MSATSTIKLPWQQQISKTLREEKIFAQIFMEKKCFQNRKEMHAKLIKLTMPREANGIRKLCDVQLLLLIRSMKKCRTEKERGEKQIKY
jgi:hypothetical protein